MPTRPVDFAMTFDLAAKATVRGLWVDAVQRHSSEAPLDSPPLYLTLPGAEARDIMALVGEGLIRTTETGAIHPGDLNRCVAIESSPAAVLSLQKRIPGLKILEHDLKSLLAGDSQIRWPGGEHETLFRARIVNLDLNSALVASEGGNSATFPVLELVRKLVTLHANAEPIEWTLCLTLRGEVRWTAERNRGTQEFLAENFELEPAFGQSAQVFLGRRLFDRIATNQDLALSRLSTENQQRFLMVYVPKVLAGYAREARWTAKTRHNLRYGGSGEAPMVTWMVDFELDQNAAHTPTALYKESLKALLSGAGYITQDGSLLAE